jgi:hypothetical protein
MKSCLAPALLAAASLLVSPVLHAEPPSDQRRAESLFRAGKASMEAEDFHAACPQLAESEALDPQPGTLLNLATCYEGLGRTASAWSTWLQAADAAAAKGESEREAFARYRASQLEPRLLRVTVTVADQPARERIGVTLDGAALARDALGVARPTDPGEHELRAAGGGLEPWALRFAVDEHHALSTVVVPVLEPIAEPARATDPVDRAHTRRTSVLTPVAWTLGGLGLAAVGLGTAFGVSAIVQENRSNDGGDCKPNNACNPAGASARNTARNDAQLADISYAIGGGAIAAAVALWLVSRSAPDRSAAAGVIVEPAIARDAWSVEVEGKW